MIKLRTLDEANIRGKRVLLRVDYNVPLDTDGNIVDDLRIIESLPTIEHILRQGASKLVIITHLGRPNGKFNKDLVTTPLAIQLESLLNKRVVKLDNCINNKYIEFIEKCDEVVFMLENLRFYPEEESNDTSFAQHLSLLGDIYINDAFGCVHRAHASIEAITNFLPSYAGFLVQKEITSLQQVINIKKEDKLAIILGGSKVSTKLLLINNLLNKAKVIMIGGAMAYTFLVAKGVSVGRSMIEKEWIDLAKDILNKAKRLGVEILLPVDHVVSSSVDNIEDIDLVKNIDHNLMAFDIGLNTVLKYVSALNDCNIVFWNGPMGIWERDSYNQGTKELAKKIAKMCKTGMLKAIIGGGDTAAAINSYGLKNDFTHISTGGGASLEFMEGKNLPGIKPLAKDVNFVF
jgi:phosphoglycerate kinase